MGAKDYDGRLLATFFPKLQEAFDLTASSYKTVMLQTATAYRFQTESGPVKYCLTSTDISSLTAGAIGNFNADACMYVNQATFGLGSEYNFVTYYNPNIVTVRIYTERM